MDSLQPGPLIWNRVLMEITMPGNRKPASQGFTLVELLVTVAVLAIALGIAVPSFQSFVSRNRLAATTNELVSALALARSEAVKRATRVTVASADWDDGWEVFVDSDPFGDSSGDTILRVYEANTQGGASITAGSNFSDYISYLPSGTSEGSGGDGDGDFTVCKDGNARVVSINNTGRVSTTAGSCS